MAAKTLSGDICLHQWMSINGRTSPDRKKSIRGRAEAILLEAFLKAVKIRTPKIYKISIVNL